jgi:hypothetical protein
VVSPSKVSDVEVNRFKGNTLFMREGKNRYVKKNLQGGNSDFNREAVAKIAPPAITTTARCAAQPSPWRSFLSVTPGFQPPYRKVNWKAGS